MPSVDFSVSTPDGESAVSLHTPDGDGPWAGVIMYPDAGGTRDAMIEMAERVAAMGYAVMVPDVYYRDAPWAPFDLATAFGDEAERGRQFGLMGTLTNERVLADGSAYVDALGAWRRRSTVGDCPARRPGQPHPLMRTITAEVLVARAKEDASFTDEHAETLDAALTEAGVLHTIEVYDALHGYAVPDNPTYDEAAAGRHYGALADLLGRNLVKG